MTNKRVNLNPRRGWLVIGPAAISIWEVKRANYLAGAAAGVFAIAVLAAYFRSRSPDSARRELLLWVAAIVALILFCGQIVWEIMHRR
jgi:peptidoglycan/LPS O-acetylase OafA/YrhL